MTDIIAARLRAAEREIAEIERELGPDDLKLSYKLDAYAELLREANQLLDASNAEARARAIRKKQFSQEVESKHEQLPKKFAYRPTNKTGAYILIALLFVGVASLLIWAQSSVVRLRTASDPRNGFADKTFLFSKDDGFVFHVETRPAPPKSDYADAGFSTERVPTRDLVVDVKPLNEQGFGPKSTVFLAYYAKNPFTLRLGMKNLIGDLELSPHEGGYEIRDSFTQRFGEAESFQDGGLWQVIWDGVPPVEPPRTNR